MRKIIVRKPTHIAPFNEPARALRVMNKPLWQWQQDLLAAYVDEQIIVDDPRNGPRDSAETVIHSENLWFDEGFLSTFIRQARLKGRAVRAAVQGVEEPPFMQNGLRSLTKSFTQRGDYFYLDLWYFPTGISEQIEALVVPSEVRQVSLRHTPIAVPGKAQRDRTDWMVPTLAACPIDSWVHVLLANVILGLQNQIESLNRSMGQGGGRMQAGLRGLFEGKPARRSSAFVRTGKNCHIDPSAVVQGPVWLGDNVSIGPGCVVTNCLIGSNVTLAHSNAFDRCVIGDDCFFPPGAGASMSVYMEGSTSGQGAVVEMSVIGRDSVIGSGTILCDFNLLPMSLKAIGDHHLSEIGWPMLGACVGHNCRVGAGLVVFPGRVIESDVVLLSSPTRRVIAKNISYEESDHHYIGSGDLHPRRYVRIDEGLAQEQGQG